MLVFEFWISNNTSRSAALYLEPWGGKYRVPCHGTLRVVIESPRCPVLEWELADDIHTLAVREPAGALATVYDEANPVVAE